jgi:segregation and condensation protein A
MPEIIKDEVPSQELDLSSYNLKLIYENLISRKVKRTNKRTGEISQIIQREKFSIKNKIREIMRNLKTKPALKFSQLYSLKNRTIPEVITGFLAMLELARLKRITLKQKVQFADITILKSKNSSNITEEL